MAQYGNYGANSMLIGAVGQHLEDEFEIKHEDGRLTREIDSENGES